MYLTGTQHLDSMETNFTNNAPDQTEIPHLYNNICKKNDEYKIINMLFLI